MSTTNAENAIEVGKGKKKKTSARGVPSNNDSSGDQAKGKQKASLKIKRRKRSYSSSDSYSSTSDSDSDSYSSDSDSYSSDYDSNSSSESYSSTSSSDRRRRKRRKLTKRGRRPYGKRGGGKLKARRNRRARRKFKRSSASSSDTCSSGSTSSRSSRSDEENKAKKLSVSTLRSVEQQKHDDRRQNEGDSSHEEAEFSQKNVDNIINGHGDINNNQAAARLHQSDNSSRSRSPSSGGMPRSIPRRSLSKSPRRVGISKISKVSAQQATRNPSRSPVRISPARKGRELSRSHSPGGTQKRVRKGRGFTERYAFVRKYRTPSPEHSPDRSYRYGGRNIQRNQDRYSSYRTYERPPRRYRSSPRGRSPPRSQSRSISRSPRPYHRCGHHSRSPICSRSPVMLSDRLKSRLGPQKTDESRQYGRFISRSKSRSVSQSRSADAGSRKHPRKVSSPLPGIPGGGQHSLVSYDVDVSPDNGVN
ncbi:hypothetical protein OROGR_019427 [Orobanche gracilis]